MMKANITMKQNLADFKTFQDKLKDFDNYVIKVGILQGKAQALHKGTKETNVDIGAKHEFGSISEKIPQRSFLRMPLDFKREELLEKIIKKSNAILRGDTKLSFKIIGVMSETIIQEAFETRGFGQWKENAPMTIALKGSDMPLIDTGQLRRSVTSEVKSKND